MLQLDLLLPKVMYEDSDFRIVRIWEGVVDGGKNVGRFTTSIKEDADFFEARYEIEVSDGKDLLGVTRWKRDEVNYPPFLHLLIKGFLASNGVIHHCQANPLKGK